VAGAFCPVAHFGVLPTWDGAPMTGIRLVSGLPDWRNMAAYSPLLRVGRQGFAWEYLRRNPEFRAQAGLAWTSRALSDPIPDLIVDAPESLDPWNLRFRGGRQSRCDQGPAYLGPRRGYQRRRRQH
jgi:hypothetical protein